MVTAVEWRQFQLLMRDSVRRLLNAAVLSRDGDPWQFAIWATALVQTPPTLYAISQGAKYVALRHAPAARMEPVVLGDRLFFVFYAMTAAALLASVTWEALFPDRTDQEIVGSLPVRPRTLAAARLSAAVVMALAFALAIGLPSAVLFAFFAAAHPAVGAVYAVFAGQLVAVVGGALSVFLALLVVRSAAALLMSPGAAHVLAAVLQLTSVSVLIEAFLYSPSILPRLVHATIAGDAEAMRLPPVWFGALYSVVAGSARPVMWTEAARGVFALAGLLPTTLALYLLPSAWMSRRALESSPTRNTRVLSAVTRAIAALLSWRPHVRPLLTFVLASFTRSRRHALIVVTQLGVGIAIAAVSVISATVRRAIDPHQPATYLLAVPLVLIFFVALGVRSAFTLPLELEANWPFRLVGTDVLTAAAATRAAMMALGVLPLTALGCAAFLVLGWPPATVAAAGLLDVVAGVLLVECVAYGWHAVPFAREHVFASQSLKWRGLIMVVPLIVFAFVNARIQLVAIDSPRAAAWYVALVSGLTLGVRELSHRESTRHGIVFDDEPADALAVLNLSNAL